MSALPPVSVSPGTGEAFVWSLEVPARRKADGSWVFGAAAGAIPSADELKDNFEPCWDSNRCAMLVQEARSALASSPSLAKPASHAR